MSDGAHPELSKDAAFAFIVVAESPQSVDVLPTHFVTSAIVT